MNDPNPVAADPDPTAVPDPAPAPEILPLVELYPACFDRERPRPLRINIHQHLIRAGHDRAAVLRSLKAYCTAPRYRASLQAGAARIDLHGQPAGVVTDKEAAHARQEPTPRAAERAAARESLPPDATPIPKENLVPGRLELTVKFAELPRPLPVQGGIKIDVQTEEGTVTAILPPKVWRTLEQAAKDYPQWVATLSGSLERFADGEIALQHPAVQVFEKKARPEAAAEGKGPDSSGPIAEAPDAKASAPKPPDSNGPAVGAPDAKASAPKAPDSNGPAVGAPEPKASESNASESNAPEVNVSAGKKPEGKASAGKAPDRKTPDAPTPAPTYPKLSLKERGAAKTG